MMYTPVNPSFNIIIKVGCKVVYNSRACFPNVFYKFHINTHMIRMQDHIKLHIPGWDGIKGYVNVSLFFIILKLALPRIFKRRRVRNCLHCL